MKTIIAEACKEALIQASHILKNGGTAVFPTETVYGLGAYMTDEKAVRRIFEIKGRDENKPLSILVSEASQIKTLADVDDALLSKIAKNFWPGPFTLVAPKKNTVSDIITAKQSTVGLRIPADDFALALIKETGLPLVTTSANASGMPPATCADEAVRALNGKADIIITGKSCPVGIASTVAEYKNGSLKILRKGSISKEELENKLDVKVI